MVELPWAYIEVMDRDSCVQQAYPVEDALGRPGFAASQPLTSVWKPPLEGFPNSLHHHPEVQSM